MNKSLFPKAVIKIRAKMTENSPKTEVLIIAIKLADRIHPRFDGTIKGNRFWNVYHVSWPCFVDRVMPKIISTV